MSLTGLAAASLLRQAAVDFPSEASFIFGQASILEALGGEEIPDAFETLVFDRLSKVPRWEVSIGISQRGESTSFFATEAEGRKAIEDAIAALEGDLRKNQKVTEIYEEQDPNRLWRDGAVYRKMLVWRFQVDEGFQSPDGAIPAGYETHVGDFTLSREDVTERDRD